MATSPRRWLCRLVGHMLGPAFLLILCVSASHQHACDAKHPRFCRMAGEGGLDLCVSASAQAVHIPVSVGVELTSAPDTVERP